jgi:hypothetical protein
MPVPQIITVHNLTTNSIFISDMTQDFEIKPGATVTATNYNDPEEVQSSSELESAYRNSLVEVFLNAVPITTWPFLTPGGGALTAANFVDNETPAGTIDGVNAAFTLASAPVAGTVHLYKNGIRQKFGAGNDATISGATITFEAGNIPMLGDSLLSDYRV